MAELTDPILPPGIKVAAAIGVDEQLVVSLTLPVTIKAKDFLRMRREWDGESDIEIDATMIAVPRKTRALGALLIRQSDLIETRQFSVVKGGRG